MVENHSNLMLKEYRQLVDILFRDKSPVLIPNQSLMHNVIISGLILKNTEDNGRVWFLSDDFNKEFFEQDIILYELNKAKNRGVNFDFVCCGKCQSDKIKEFAKNNLLIEDFGFIQMKEKKNIYSINFITNGTAVRLEKDFEKPISLSCGNDKIACEKLIKAISYKITENDLTF